MTASIVELIQLNQFSTGRRLFTLGQVVELARRWENTTLVTRAEAALAHDRQTLEKEAQWRRAKASKSRARGRAFEVDNQIDRVLGGMHTSVQVLLATLPPASELAEKARRFIARFFPEGAAEITRLDFEDELAAIEEMNRDLATYSADDLKELHVAYYAGELARLTPQFAAELKQPADGFSFDTLRAARQKGHERLCLLVATILSEYDGDAPEHVDARRALLAPIVEQNARISERRRRRPAPDVDVDPTTGEELEREPDDGDADPPVS